MRLGRVLGRVTLNRAVPSLTGGRWLIVAPFHQEQFRTFETAAETRSAEPSAVVYDDIGGGVGDAIGYVEGREAAVPFDQPTPVDAYCAAIIDRVNHYQKSKP